MAMGKSNFPKNQSKLHDPMYARKGIQKRTPVRNKLKNYTKMMVNRVARRRAK